MQAKLCCRDVFAHRSWPNSGNPIGEAPASGSVVHRCCCLALTTTCSVSPRAKMNGALTTHNVCPLLGSAPIASAKATTEMPIKRPAMKLPVCRNLRKEFVMIHSDPAIMTATPEVVGALAHLRE